MNRMQRTTGMVAILALALILVGCNSPTVVVPPTQDIPSIRTEAAATVISKITIEAALNPTATAPATAVPATQQPEATATSAATPTSTAVVITAIPTFTPFPTSSGAIYPTRTVRAGPDQAQLLSQSPTDGTVENPSAEFDGAWKFKNIGTSTWNTNYSIRAAEGKGTNLAKATRYYLKDKIAPGESVNVFADMVAPSTGGRYVSYWELVNDNGAIFYNFYLVIDVK